ncbi:MAG: hypothetical protein ACUVSZ_11560 [Chloroflexus sp.]|uniref:hypothetical protein n=1 Tax=Chloroflexus sp. TaxID=1904827 RepID=UPI00404A2384
MTSYTIQWSKENSKPCDLPDDKPIYELIPSLVKECQLRETDEQQHPIQYELFDMSYNLLNKEISLAKNNQPPGATLYLADRNRRWFVSAAPVVPAPVKPPLLPLSGNLSIPAVVGLGLIVVIVILFTRMMTGSDGRFAASLPTLTIEPFVPNVTPSAVSTLAPPSTPIVPTPTKLSTLVPVLPTPTSLSPTLASTPTYLEIVSGVKPEYRSIKPELFFVGRTSFGAFLWQDSKLREKIPATEGYVVVSNGDQIEILARLGQVYQVRIHTNVLDPDDPKVIGAVGYLPAWIITDQDVPPTPTPKPRPSPTPKLRVVKVNEDDSPDCISMQIRNINANGWLLRIDGYQLFARFDGGGNARLCGVPNHAFTFSILDNKGQAVPGGQGIPAKGRDIFIGEWR